MEGNGGLLVESLQFEDGRWDGGGVNGACWGGVWYSAWFSGHLGCPHGLRHTLTGPTIKLCTDYTVSTPSASVRRSTENDQHCQLKCSLLLWEDVLHF